VLLFGNNRSGSLSDEEAEAEEEAEEELEDG